MASERADPTFWIILTLFIVLCYLVVQVTAAAEQSSKHEDLLIRYVSTFADRRPHPIHAFEAAACCEHQSDHVFQFLPEVYAAESSTVCRVLGTCDRSSAIMKMYTYWSDTHTCPCVF